MGAGAHAGNSGEVAQRKEECVAYGRQCREGIGAISDRIW